VEADFDIAEEEAAGNIGGVDVEILLGTPEVEGLLQHYSMIVHYGVVVAVAQKSGTDVESTDQHRSSGALHWGWVPSRSSGGVGTPGHTD